MTLKTPITLLFLVVTLMAASVFGSPFGLGNTSSLLLVTRRAAAVFATASAVLEK